MKVSVIPTGLHSRAMLRVAEALEKYAPPGVKFVRPSQADVQVLHTISPDSAGAVVAKEYVVIQYCYNSSASPLDWNEWLWNKSRFVWSYYDLRDQVKNVPFYFAPLGVDGNVFTINGSPRNSVLTSGFVSGPGAEPIEEMALAAQEASLPVNHVGPAIIEGMKSRPANFKSYFDISDKELVSLYNKSLWVSGMRYVEGFEVPVIEGLACGARPICFDRSDMRQWYDGHAVFVPETQGQELRGILRNVLQSSPSPVTMEERTNILNTFNWETIANGFWKMMNV